MMMIVPLIFVHVLYSRHWDNCFVHIFLLNLSPYFLK